MMWDPAQFYDVLVISSSAEQNGEFRGMIPPDKIITANQIGDRELGMMQDFFDNATRHKATIQGVPELGARYDNGEIDQATYEAELDRLSYGHKFLLYLEDLSTNRGSFNHDIVRNIFKRGRHNLMTIMLSLHGSKGLELDLRENTRFLFVAQVKRITAVHEDFFCNIESTKAFLELYMKSTQDHHLLVDARPLTAKRNKSQIPLYYKFKPPCPVPVKPIGGIHLWVTHYIMYDPDRALKIRAFQFQYMERRALQARKQRTMTDMQNMLATVGISLDDWYKQQAIEQQQTLNNGQVNKPESLTTATTVTTTAAAKPKKTRRKKADKDIPAITPPPLIPATTFKQQQQQRPPSPVRRMLPTSTTSVPTKLPPQLATSPLLKQMEITNEQAAFIGLSPGSYPLYEIIQRYQLAENNRRMMNGEADISLDEVTSMFVETNRMAMSG